jgi:hypothetical protein
LGTRTGYFTLGGQGQVNSLLRDKVSLLHSWGAKTGYFTLTGKGQVNLLMGAKTGSFAVGEKTRTGSKDPQYNHKKTDSDEMTKFTM